MTNERYKKIQYIIRRLSYHMQVCDELQDEEITQWQNFGHNMEDESEQCAKNESYLASAFLHIQDAIDELKEIEP